MSKENFNFLNGLTDVAGLINVKKLAAMDNCEEEVKQISNYLFNAFKKAMPQKFQKIERAVYLDSRTNGLVFDWETNDHSSPFRIFYNKTMGAVRDSTAAMCYLYRDGKIRGWYFSDDNPENEHELPDSQFKGDPNDFIDHKILGA